MVDALWEKKEIVASLSGTIFGNLPDHFHGVSIDSRSLSRGDLFFAIRGNRFDGHQFAEAAVARGAGALVVDKGHQFSMRKLNAPLIIVDDVLKALQRLACAARTRSRAKIVAITGSVGKTTTKEALKLALEAVGRVHANPASFNNHWGVPLTLARLPRDADYGVFEIGMNHAGEIRALGRLVRPNLAIVTRIAAVHLENFSGLDGITRAKGEIFEEMANDGQALLNGDDQSTPLLRQIAISQGVSKIRTFGESSQADYRLLNCKLSAQCSCLEMTIGSENALIKIGAPGRHFVQDCLAVMGACDMLGADVARAAMALQKFRAESGRGARHLLLLPSGGTFTLLDESYNANPASMRAALEVLAANERRQGRRIAVLGDMLELGNDSANLHRELMQPIQAAGVELLFLVGPQMKHLALLADSELQTIWRRDVDELLPLLLQDIRKDDIIMVKSSNSVGTQRIVSGLLAHYNQQSHSSLA